MSRDKAQIIQSKAQILQGHSQIGGLAFLHLFALATGSGLLAAQLAGDTHEQTTLAQEETTDVHQHEQQQQGCQAQSHYCTQTEAAEQGVC